MANPQISIVVPTHNTRDLTLALLEKLGQVAGSDAEIVIVDDGSRDGTSDAVRAAWPGVVLLSHATAGGFTAAANHGLSVAHGEILLLLNSDAWLDAEGVPRVAAAFAADPRLGIAGANLRDPGGHAQWNAGVLPSLSWLFLLASGMAGLAGRFPGYRRVRSLEPAARPRPAWVSGAAMAIRRATWREVGPLDERFRLYAQDLDFCVRAADAGWRVTLLADWRVVHIGGASIGALAGSATSGVRPGLLWLDLLRWGRKRHGVAWASRAAWLMRVGCRLRLHARRLARVFAREDRAAWQRDTAALQDALGLLSLPAEAS